MFYICIGLKDHIKYLLQRDIQVNSLSKNGFSALHIAAYKVWFSIATIIFYVYIQFGLFWYQYQYWYLNNDTDT